MKKRFLSLLLMLCMLTALMPITVGAESIQYVVAGSYSLFGSTWDFTSESGHIMTEKNGKYELHLSPAEACGTVVLKVAKLTNGVIASNSDFYGDASGNDIEIYVSGGGEILIVFDPSTHEITVSGDNVTMINGLQIVSMRTVGRGDGNWLSGANWNPADDANLMTETSHGVYEITYNDIDAYDDYQFKFAANGSWTYIWGGSIDSEDAVYNGNNIIFEVKQDNSTVKMVFDFTNFDYATKTGAIYKLYVNNVQINASQTTEKNITLGTSALSGYDSTNNKYKYVYYGTYQQNEYTPTTLIGNPQENTVYTDTDTDETKFIYRSGKCYKYELIKWRVLDMAYNYDKNNSNRTGMLVLSENALAKTQFGTNSTWSGSTAQKWCNSMYDSSFGTGDGTKEQDFILGTTSTDGILSNDYLFFLSEFEASNSEYFPDQSSRIAKLNSSAVHWWLRSRDDDIIVFGVSNDGNIIYIDAVNSLPANRPAFNLNSSSVLFTSAALGGKSGNVGTLSANAENTGSEYKLTMKDSTRSRFTAKATAVSGKVLTVSYTNAKTGENEYISAIIVNADGEVTHYGKLANVKNESGTAPLDLTGVTLASTDKIYIFNEQINGDYKTDFASELKEIKTNITLTKEKVSAYLVGNSATLIVASYKDKALKDEKTITVTSNIYEKTLAEIGLDTNGADSIKAFLWTDMENITPLCEEQEVILNQSAS